MSNIKNPMDGPQPQSDVSECHVKPLHIYQPIALCFHFVGDFKYDTFPQNSWRHCIIQLPRLTIWQYDRSEASKLILSEKCGRSLKLFEACC